MNFFPCGQIDDRNLNDKKGKGHHETVFVLNFEDLDFDIVSYFDIRIFATVDAFRQHVKLPKSNVALSRHCTSLSSAPQILAKKRQGQISDPA